MKWSDNNRYFGDEGASSVRGRIIKVVFASWCINQGRCPNQPLCIDKRLFYAISYSGDKLLSFRLYDILECGCIIVKLLNVY